MPFTLKMPKLSPTMEAGTIAKWHVKEGDAIEVDQLLMEVSTDKATVEYNAIDSGFIRKILIAEGKDAKVNQPIAILSETKDEDISSYKPEVVVQSIAAPTRVEEPTVVLERVTGERVFASPLARKLAKDQGIDLSQITGSGPRGRIMSRDLKPTATSVVIGNAVKEIPSPIRKVIADRLQAAKNSIPHFYVKEEVDATALIAERHQLKEQGHPITLNDLMVKAAGLTLKKHPEINSGFDPQDRTLLRFKTIDISIAVDAPSGLITPIITNADTKTVLEISQDIKGLVAKAKEGKLQPHEFQGGSFTVSNLGMFGISEFSAIINPPQGAILAVGAALPKPRYINGQLQKRDIMMLTISVDHRVIDGAQAAKFLNSLKTLLESPALLLI